MSSVVRVWKGSITRMGGQNYYGEPHMVGRLVSVIEFFKDENGVDFAEVVVNNFMRHETHTVPLAYIVIGEE